MAEGEKIIPINIEEEMKSAYIDYSMSVIVSRALPDVRDGLKPVHRRVLFGMLDLGLFSNRPYKKSARIVGEVLGKYHPHGDTSVYDAMVRMAQQWSLRYPLVDGQGNFGSMDNDSPAAMRYTEARLKKIAEEMLADIDKETVDFQLNFDDSLEEPTVLPAKIPNLLINGTSGIAVGMATNMPPHNLSEVIDATIAFIDNREIDIAGLMKYVKAPDFPTGGIIYGYEGVKSAFETGRGRIMMRAHATIEEMEGGSRERIIISEIPYQVNKAEMIKQTADLVNEKKLEGISEIRDESDRTGLRIVYELKRDAISNVVLNNLFKYTALQTSFSVNNIALVGGRPKTLNLKEIISCFVDHRHEVVIRRAKFELRKAEERAHILEGLIIASDNIDEVIRIIRSSQSPQLAKDALKETFKLSDLQANAIVEMRLRQLTGLEQDKLRTEYNEVKATIEHLKALLASEPLRMELIKKELLEIRDKYGDDRRTDIVFAAEDMKIEDMIPDEVCAVTISHLGYIKRTPLSEYRRQNRGGKGSVGSSARDEDFLEHLFVATAHNYLLIFTQKGRCYWMRVFEIPEGQKTGKGRAIQNLINIEKDDKVMAYINVKDLNNEEYINNNYIVLCTQKGVIKKTFLELYSRPRKNGIIAINIREGDQLLEAKLTNGKNEILMALKSGRALRFNERKVRPMGRNASGVRGIRLANTKDEVIGMVCVPSKGPFPPEEIESEITPADIVDQEIEEIDEPAVDETEETIEETENGNGEVEEILPAVTVEEVLPGETTILVVSEKGYGKRTHIDEYRITNRGGKGVKTINITDKTGKLIAIKDVIDTDDLMIICKSGITIRMAVTDLRVIGRATQGVRLINLQEGDAIAAVAKIDASKEVAENGNGNGNGNPENGSADLSGPSGIVNNGIENVPEN